MRRAAILRECPTRLARGRAERLCGRLRSLVLAAAVTLAALGGLLACFGRDGVAADTEGWVDVRGRRIAVEIADDPVEQARGLGGRDHLPWDHGMYFVYDEPAFYTYWMKDMRFSIDIVWIREGRIVDMDPGVPFDPNGNGPTVRPSSLVDAVLEVPAGYALAHGWQIGDRVRFERRAHERAELERPHAPD